MSDNPLIEGFLNLHEAGGVGGGMSGAKFSNAASYAPAVSAGVRGAFNNVTMDAGKYVRAAIDTNAKNLGSLVGVSEPTTYYKEIEQEREKDIAAQRDYPVAYDIGDKLATAAQVASGAGAVKALGTAALRAGIRSVAKNTGQTIAKNADAGDFELGMKNALNLTPQMRVPSKPLNLTPQMRAPKPTLKLTQQMRTEEQNDSSKGNTEMSTNPYIKGFFDIEEARAKNTNIFDESKKLTAAQKKNLDKNDNDKIDAEDFKMLRKEEAIEEADLSDFKRKSVPGLHNFDHYEHPDGSFIQVSPHGHGVYQDNKGARKDFTSIQHLKTLFKEEAYLDEAKKTNSMVMARNISKVLKAVKPDFLDIDKDGDKEESMKKAAADKKIDEAVSDEHRERALATINARISKPGQPPKHPTYDGAPADIKTAVDNLAKMYAESVDLDEGIKEKIGGMIRREKEKEYPLLQNRRDVAAGKAAKSYAAGDEKKGDRYMKFRSDNMKKEEVEFSEEEIDFINNVMEAMPVAPTSENDSPNPTPKKKAEGSRAKGSMAD